MKNLDKFKLCGTVDAPSTGKLLYLILSDLADESGEIIISQRKIRNALHISKSAVSRNLRRLRDGGYIDVYPRYHDDGGRAANLFKIR